MKGIKIKDMYFADAYLQMFDLLDDCIIIIDKYEKIIFMNKASESLDKLKREEVIGKKYREVCKVNVHSSSTLKCLNSKMPVINMFQDYITESGNNIITISSSYPLVEDGEMQGVFSVTKDMSKYKEHMKIFNKNYKPKDKDQAHSEILYIEDEGVDDHLKEIERNIRIDQLEKCDGNVTRAADRLGLSRQTLDYRLKKYKIKI